MVLAGAEQGAAVGQNRELPSRKMVTKVVDNSEAIG
jgi:hypothetical protein